MRKILPIIVMLLIFSCHQKEEDFSNSARITIPVTADSIIKNESPKVYQSYLKKDPGLTKEKIDWVYLKRDRSDTLVAFCNCQKNIAQNTLIIQPRIEFPSKSELDKGNRTPTYFLPGLPRQYRFPTIYLKDSTVQKIELLKASEEKQFDNQKTDSVAVVRYQIHINTYDYRIAQNVWGAYKLILPEELGYSENDTIISGTFHCNNWKAVRYENLGEWTEHQRLWIDWLSLKSYLTAINPNLSPF